MNGIGSTGNAGCAEESSGRLAMMDKNPPTFLDRLKRKHKELSADVASLNQAIVDLEANPAAGAAIDVLMKHSRHLGV